MTKQHSDSKKKIKAHIKAFETKYFKALKKEMLKQMANKKIQEDIANEVKSKLSKK